MDYLWTFPRTGLDKALTGLTALRIELGLPSGTLPGNALGDPRDASGAVVTPLPADDLAKPAPDPTAWIGRPGSAASSYEDMDGKTIDVPARGDPSKYYMHIRTGQDVEKFDPSQYGLMPSDPAESAAVLGVWAGDVVPT
jgi:hypothetical protein